MSGIGPEETLSKFNIQLVHANKNVGKNLIDRKAASVALPAFKDLEGDVNSPVDMVAISKNAWSFFIHKNALEWGSSFQRCSTCKPVDRTASCGEQITAALMFYGSGTHQSKPHLISFASGQRLPRTRGNVTLASSNYQDDIIVHDGWSTTMEDLSEVASKDLDILIEGVHEHFIDMVKKTNLLQNLGLEDNVTSGNFSEPLRDFTTNSQDIIKDASGQLDKCKFVKHPYDNCLSWEECIPSIPVLPINDEEALREIIFNNLASGWHMVGTCKVGEVVKKETMEVIGVKNLYVSDSSVLPEAVDIHPQMTVMSLGIILGNNAEIVSDGGFELFPVILSTTFCGLVLFLPLVFLINFLWKIKKKSSTSRTTEFASVRKSLREESSSRTTIMEWHDVSCTYETKAKKVTTLFNNTGKIVTGELTALMGPSGMFMCMYTAFNAVFNYYYTDFNILFALLA